MEDLILIELSRAEKEIYGRQIYNHRTKIQNKSI